MDQLSSRQAFGFHREDGGSPCCFIEFGGRILARGGRGFGLGQIRSGVGNVALVVNVRYKKRPLDGGGFWTFFNQLAPVYGVLFLATSALGLLLTRAIVGPLRALRDSMNQLDLKSPVPLSYPQNDAIGELVSEYNRLQQELSTKLEELTRREREGAWRTMAVQVAHEVKNPLTPLMLGVQQLEKAYRDNHPDFPVRIRRFAQMAQTQIESLSQIAEDFRNLSQWDELPVKRTDLLAVLRSATDLFVLGQPGIQWSFEIPEEEIWVWASPTHLTRVFNNLINNALDAIRETHDGRMGEVSIVIRPEKDSCRVILQDNGVGISIENMKRIFDPQFTTKAQGSGLGLAMVKAIMEQFGGSIEWSAFHVDLEKGPLKPTGASKNESDPRRPVSHRFEGSCPIFDEISGPRAFRRGNPGGLQGPNQVFSPAREEP